MLKIGNCYKTKTANVIVYKDTGKYLKRIFLKQGIVVTVLEKSSVYNVYSGDQPSVMVLIGDEKYQYILENKRTMKIDWELLC